MLRVICLLLPTHPSVHLCPCRSFARGPNNHAVNDERAALLILTLTEVHYRENASPWSCRPAACAPQQDSTFPTATPTETSVPEELVARYAVGVA